MWSCLVPPALCRRQSLHCLTCLITVEAARLGFVPLGLAAHSTRPPTRGREVSEHRVRADPDDAATSSTCSGGSGDSLLRQVEEYTEGSASTSQKDVLVLLDDEGTEPIAGPPGDRGYRAAPMNTLSGLATDLDPSKIRPHAARKAFTDAGIDPQHFYLIIPTPTDRAHNPPRGHMTVYTRALTFGMTLPFHPFVKALCSLHRISPAQLSPNCWVTINSMIILWRKFLSLDLTVEEFLHY
ncbi:hypothetical protein L484_004923 [Morus notabilis]|uniref:Transposase (putative) gypsy type domain-containing protein n=1 Tax=Morus notabilis TaxID=981085 RepID=W9RE22_9ROSA|nr:hypothetical protein L484_004923 [Morus notabilis]